MMRRLLPTGLTTILITWLYLAVTVLPLSAQTQNATITGIVTDKTAAAIPGAQVTVTNQGTGIKASATTDSGGQYTILNLLPGLYDIQASGQGFSTVIRLNQELFVGTTVKLDFTLSVSSVTQTIQVNAQTEQVETTESEVSRVLQTRELDNLPVLNRQFAALAVLTPGVQAAGVSYGGGGTATSQAVSIGNAPTYQTGYILDGMQNETGNQGGAYVQLAQDWVQEFSLMSLQFPVEYGGASAGVINAVTRSGTNQIHGRAYIFYQTGALDSNPEFYTAPTKAPFNAYRVGGMTGGPILKDKLFYFLGYEKFYQAQTNVISATASSAAWTSTDQALTASPDSLVPWLIFGNVTSAPVTNYSNLAIAKLNFTPNSKDSFLLKGNLDYELTLNSGFGGSGTYGTGQTAWDPNFTEALDWTRTLSANSINDLSATYLVHDGGAAGVSNFCAVRGRFDGTLPPGAVEEPYNYTTTESLGGNTIWGNPVGAWTQVGYSGVTTGGNCSGLLNGDESAVIAETYSHIAGKHTLKFGGSGRRYIILDQSSINTTAGAYKVNSTTPFSPTAAINGAGNFNLLTAAGLTSATYTAAQKLAPYSYVEDFPSNPALTHFDFHSYAVGVYAEDTWQYRPNLTFNSGLRYDFNNTNSAEGTDSFPALAAAVPGSHGFLKPGNPPINNDAFDFGPRIGLAWEPFRDEGRTVVRGGFGIFYDQNDTASAAVFNTGNAWAPTGYSIVANNPTQNPYCVSNPACSITGGVPVQYELAVLDVLASALENYTLPQFPNAGAPCAATNSCAVIVGGKTYTIPALTVTSNPQGNFLDINPNYKTPGEMQLTGGIEHQFRNSLMLSADYLYHRGFNQLDTVNTNLAQTGVGGTGYTIINPAFTTNLTLESISSQVANDLQVKASYHDHRTDAFQLAYQFGYAHDNSWTAFAISAHNTDSTNPFNPNTDYGPSSTDARHVLNVSGNVNMHWGILLAPIFAYTSALPMTPTSSLQAPGISASCPAYYTRCYPIVGSTTYSRDSVRGGDYIDLSGRLSKSVKLGESRSVTAYFESYNVTNRWNLTTNYNLNVDITTGTSAFLTPNGTSEPLRQVQFGGRFDF